MPTLPFVVLLADSPEYLDKAIWNITTTKLSYLKGLLLNHIMCKQQLSSCYILLFTNKMNISRRLHEYKSLNLALSICETVSIKHDILLNVQDKNPQKI